MNEPDNGNVHSYGRVGARVPAAADAFGTELSPLAKARAARGFAEKALLWAREARPSQPLTIPVYLDPTGDAAADALRAQTYNWTLSAVDILSFHDYQPLGGISRTVQQLQPHGRPLVCSEYMARTVGSTFDPVLGFLRQQKAWAIHWGWVAGKSQTIFPWNSWNVPYAREPVPWHHDVLHADGTPYSEREAAYIRNHSAASPRERAVRLVV